MYYYKCISDNMGTQEQDKLMKSGQLAPKNNPNLEGSLYREREKDTIFIFWKPLEREMMERESEHLQLALLFIFLELLHVCLGDVGTAGQYAPPYLRKYQRPITAIQSFQTDTCFFFFSFF